MFRFSVWIGGRTGNWIAGSVFAAVGLIFLLVAPQWTGSGPDAATGATVLRALGGFFAGLGLLVLGWLLVDLWLGAKDSPRRHVWYWWGAFLMPMLAAAAFSVPATLVLPAFVVAYLARPDFVFPAGQPVTANNFWIGALFSVCGVLGLVLMYFVGRAALRDRPRLDAAEAPPAAGKAPRRRRRG